MNDPLLRSAILPLFAFDKENSSKRPLGYGTAFRIDPWGTCATAFHVIEDLLEFAADQLALHPNKSLAALELEHVVYGLAPVKVDQWRFVAGIHAVTGIEQPPLGLPRLRNVSEIAALLIPRSYAANGPMTLLPIDFTRWQPQVGETIMALGFAELDVDKAGGGETRPMSQYLYGSEASIFQVNPADPSSGRPWPTFIVEAQWPGGMSGGPIFNEAGHVVGIVSAGIDQIATASGTFFAGWDIAEKTFLSLDVCNPGWIKCWAAFDTSDRVVCTAPSEQGLDTAIDAGIGVKPAFVTYNPNSGDFVLLNPQ